MNIMQKIIYKLTVYLKIPHTLSPVETANIEICAQCNLNCKMCGFEHKRKQGLMDFETFKKIVDELKKNGKPVVALHQYGEPLLHPQLAKFIDYLTQNNLKIHLYSNCTLLDKGKRQILSKHPVDSIRVSFYPEKEVYERIWKNAHYEQTVKNLRAFLAESKQWPFKTKLVVNLLHEPNAHIKSILAKAKKIFGHQGNLNFQFDEMVNLDGSDKDLSYLATKPKIVPCANTYLQAVFLHTGDVSVCCNDLNGRVILGNIKKQTLKSIRNSQKMIKFRQGFAQNRIHKICANCPGCHSENNLFINDLKKITSRFKTK